MQFSTKALLAVVAASAVSADAVFSVSDFTAGCIPHSAQCSYSFDVVKSGAGETIPVKCEAQLTSDGTLPAVPAGTCTDSSRTWTIAKGADGALIFTVSQPVSPSSSQTGTYTITAGDLTTETTGASTQQVYTGPTAFDLV